AQLGILVQHPGVLLPGVLVDQLLESHQRLGEGVVVVELRRAMHGCLSMQPERKKQPDCDTGNFLHDGLLSSLTVMRHSVRGSSGSVSVAEWSSDALSQITTSPTPYFRRSWYFSCVACRFRSSSSATASSRGIPSMPKELPDIEYSAVRPVTGCGRATRCRTQVTFFYCSSV